MNINEVSHVFDSFEEIKQEELSRETDFEILYAIAKISRDRDEYQKVWENGANATIDFPYTDFDIVDFAMSIIDNDKDFDLDWGNQSFLPMSLMDYIHEDEIIRQRAEIPKEKDNPVVKISYNLYAMYRNDGQIPSLDKDDTVWYYGLEIDPERIEKYYNPGSPWATFLEFFKVV